MKWSNIWSYTQQDYRSWPSTIREQKQVIRIRSNHYGQSLKLRFSNQFGEEDLIFEQVRVRICQEDGEAVSETKVVTVNGKEQVFIVPTANLISDEVALAVVPGAVIEIETVVRGVTILRSGTISYSKGSVDVYNYSLADANEGLVEQEEAFRMIKENNQMFFIYGISGVDLLTSDSARTIVAFGDSLTQQGFWVEAFKQRLLKAKLHEVAVLNRGIGGSRVLKGQNPLADEYTRHGQAGLFRFEKEVFAYGCVDAVIILHGINDLISRHDGTNEYHYTVTQIIDGLKQYAKLAHQHNIEVIIGTLTPLGKSMFYSEALELERKEINTWISQSDCFDHVIDFDMAVHDEAQVSLLRKECDAGDGLHISAIGGEKMASIIELSYVNSIIHTQKKEEEK